MSTDSPRRERKVVTVVFCDLVGFTSRAERLDPEDVEALLNPYHHRLRSELERYSGTVEKFIGDAVMALFGAPVAHEDDPERAVRAALAIRDWALEHNEVQVRLAVTTGEALIRLDARPEAGEGMASGDVVNTAARLQAAAPVNAVLVDETTYRATRHVIDHEEAEPVEAKGKAEPIAVWRPRAARARFGVDVAHEARAELVGRERELAVMREAFGRVIDERMSQLVTLVGVPGIGKSRLVYELSRIADADPQIITWRQGRCLAYGEGVTLWALGEIVKAQAGIVEQDTSDDARVKVEQAVANAIGESDEAGWIASHVRSLVGLAEESELGGDRRGEAFAAWRRFLEALAERRPLVLVFEDLHWADEILLDFVDELVDWVSDVPLLVVGTARPELLERRPGWGGGKLNATTLALAPLSDEQTAFLIGQLLERPVLEAESQRALLERAGGNPLYAEQFSDLFVERGSVDDLPLPETLQGIIAARLDALPEREKGLLRDAAVVGKVFWLSALRRETRDAAATLHALERKGFVRRQKRSSVEGEHEFAFAHALVRDVAYGQIARGDRAEKHQQTAEWIESLGRPEDHAEMLGHHWRAALELARAAGADDAVLVERARLALRSAGDRAFALNSFGPAATQYEDALALWPEDDSEGPNLLFRWARALYYAYDDRRGDALETARDALLGAGDREGAAEAESFLALHFWYRGLGELADRHLSRAEELTRDSVSASAARVLTVSARTRAIGGEALDGKRIAQAALAMAEALGLDELRAHALATIGMAKRDLDDPSGDEDMERAFELAVKIDSPIAAPTLNNLAVTFLVAGDLPRTDELWAEAFRLAERFGDRQTARFIRANRAWMDWARGRWGPALEDVEAMIRECESGFPHALEHGLRMVRGNIRAAHGDTDGAVDDHLRAVALAREKGDPIQLVGALAVYASTLAEHGRWDEARILVEELIVLMRAKGVHGAVASLSPYADQLGLRQELRAAVEDAPKPAASAWREAALRALEHDFSASADAFAAMGSPTLEAGQRLHAGERLIELGRRVEGEAELRNALAFYESVNATHYARRAEGLLAKSA